MTEDLKHFLAARIVIQSVRSPGWIVPMVPENALQVASTSVGKIASTSASTGTESSGIQPIKIVPKGLRSFDAHDTDFFLELLPGPRDREGLPDSLPSDPSTVRAMLVLPEGRGLVSRNTHPTDGRARTVALTAAGLRKYRQVWKAGQAIRDQMVSSLSAEEMESLVRLLRRVSESFADASMVMAAAST